MTLSVYRRVASVTLALGLAVAAVEWATAQSPDRQQWLRDCVVAYGRENFDPASGLIKDSRGQPSVAGASAGYVAAALAVSPTDEQAGSVLRSVLANQDQDEQSTTWGQFPWTTKESGAYSLAATYRVVPLLAHIYQQWGQQLSETVRADLMRSLELCYQAIRRPQPLPEGLTAVLRMASLATLGAALDKPAATDQSRTELDRWLQRLTQAGWTQGHSPTTDAYRIAALKWIWQSLPPSQRSGELQAALELVYRDLAARVQLPTGALAGAALHTSVDDYLHGGRYSRYLIYADLHGPEPDEVGPLAMFFTVPQYRPAVELALDTPAQPHQLITAAQDETPVTRTDTYVHPQFSLGTMSGRPSVSSIPLLVTFSGGEKRPTAYFFAQPQASGVSSVQHENIALITVDFDGIGTGQRRTAMLHGVLGPREQIDEVYVSGRPWNGQPVAVAEQGKVALRRLGCNIGITLLRAGPAEVKQVISGPQPGVLRWSDEGPEAELELLVYARKRSYPLAVAQNNLRAGVAVEIEPAAGEESLSEFARHLATARARQTVERTKTLIPEPEDPYDAFLHEHDPKPKSELRYEYQLLHTIQYRSAQTTLYLQEDMLREVVTSRQIDGEEVSVLGSWALDSLVIPWGGNLSDCLTRQR